MPEISVIVPAYNVEKYLDKCMKSILDQTFEDFEVLLIDDGAKDTTPQICDKYAVQDSRVKVYHKINGGLSDARNYGLDRMSGKYVTFIDSDDSVDVNYLGYMYDLLKKNNAQIAIVQGQVLLETEKPLETKATKEKTLKTVDAVRMMLLRRDATHTSWGKLYDAALWEKIRFPKGQNYEDYATTYNVFAQADTVAYSDAGLYFYIQRTGSIMHDACSLKTLSVLDISDTVSEFIRIQWPECKEEALDLQVHTYLKNLQQILKMGNNAFLEYQERIIKFIKNNQYRVIFGRKFPIKDKVKVLSLMMGKRIFQMVYNSHDGDRRVS